jgi:sugar phosphate permease
MSRKECRDYGLINMFGLAGLEGGLIGGLLGNIFNQAARAATAAMATMATIITTTMMPPLVTVPRREDPDL